MPSPRVQDVACEIILSHPSSSAKEIADLVRLRLPGCHCSAASIGWYKSKLKQGKIGFAPSGGFTALEKTQPPPKRNNGGPSKWPDFGEIVEQDLLQLAGLTTPHACFLHPDIVRGLVEDNERRREGWRKSLSERGVNPDLYLWPKSPCAFPGVRRYAGSEEIAVFRKQRAPATHPAQAIALDDNDYPKQIWSFVFQGRKFAKAGPQGYALAHLFDHKVYKNRISEECEIDGTGETNGSPAFGLFTCPTNTAYLPIGLIRPTDFSLPLRSVMQRRAEALYGDFCRLLPTHLAIKLEHASQWSVEAFAWREPVGTLEHVEAFLDYRNATMERLLAAANGDAG